VLASGLKELQSDFDKIDARADLLYGAWLGGTCLAKVGMGLHHKLCHTLGGSFGLPHAHTHAVLLPYAMEYNVTAAGDAMARTAAAARQSAARTSSGAASRMITLLSSLTGRD
jgi:alcohol dehydrogenase class IV